MWTDSPNDSLYDWIGVIVVMVVIGVVIWVYVNLGVAGGICFSALISYLILSFLNRVYFTDKLPSCLFPTDSKEPKL